MRLTLILMLTVLAALSVYLFLDLGRLGAWAVDAQRGFQNQMAGAVRALKAGDPSAYFALLSATAAYGFVHALGPGHGKYLVGGVGMGTQISPLRLVSLATISSLAQSLWAILLVYGGFFLLEATAQQMTVLAEDFLRPASYVAIALVGLVLVWRGIASARKLLAASDHHHHAHGDGDCGCHAHGPTPEQAARVSSLRDAVALVLSIAIRPCTGAIFLLVITWQMDIKFAGALAVIVMGFGTAGLTSLVAVSSIAARRIAFASATSLKLQVAVPALQVFAGAVVMLISLGLLKVAL